MMRTHLHVGRRFLNSDLLEEPGMIQSTATSGSQGEAKDQSLWSMFSSDGLGFRIVVPQGWVEPYKLLHRPGSSFARNALFGTAMIHNTAIRIFEYLLRSLAGFQTTPS